MVEDRDDYQAAHNEVVRVLMRSIAHMRKLQVLHLDVTALYESTAEQLVDQLAQLPCLWHFGPMHDGLGELYRFEQRHELLRRGIVCGFRSLF